MQARYREAFDAFYKAAWSAAWQDAAYFELARLAAWDGRPEEALGLLERSLARNARHYQARHLKAAVLRRLGRTTDAERETAAALELDPLDFGALWERFLLLDDPTFSALSPADTNANIAISLDYAHAGLFDEAIDLVRRAPPDDPLVGYYLGWYLALAGHSRAAEAFRAAASVSPDGPFPNRLECVPALQCAMQLNPADARAPYHLGNFWYAHRRYAEAVAAWEQARDRDPSFPTVYRNLGLAYFNSLQDPERALRSYEQAFALDADDRASSSNWTSYTRNSTGRRRRAWRTSSPTRSSWAGATT